MNLIVRQCFSKRGEVLSDYLIAAYNLSNGIDIKNGNNLATTGTIIYGLGVNGNCSTFTGSSFYKTTNNAFKFHDDTNDLPFSISFFGKVSSNSVSNAFVTTKSTDSNINTMRIFISGGYLYFTLDQYPNGNYIYYATNSLPPVNVFNHYVITYDGSKNSNSAKIYINGNLVSLIYGMLGTYTGMNETGVEFAVGVQAALNQYKLNGSMDELYVFNKVLNQTEVTKLNTNFYPNIDF